MVIFVDPFEEFLAQKRLSETPGSTKKPSEAGGKAPAAGGAENEDDARVTWTGKRVRGVGSGTKDNLASGIGKYMKSASGSGGDDGGGFAAEEEQESEQARKKMKGTARGGFGNFDSW